MKTMLLQQCRNRVTAGRTMVHDQWIYRPRTPRLAIRAEKNNDATAQETS